MAPGMSLRDYFAACAMMSCARTLSPDTEQLAKTAYEMADAMLKERSKKS